MIVVQKRKKHMVFLRLRLNDFFVEIFKKKRSIIVRSYEKKPCVERKDFDTEFVLVSFL